MADLILTVLDLSYKVAKSLYRYSKNVKAASDSIQQLSNELFALIGVLEHLKLQRHDQDIEASTAVEAPRATESLTRVLEETVVFLQELQGSLKVPESRLKSAVQQLKLPFKDDEISGHLRRLERVKTYLILSQMTNQIDRTESLAQQISSLSVQVAGGISNQRASETEHTYAKILEWLAPAAPQNTYDTILQYRVDGSGDWFSNSKSVWDWMDSSVSSTYWLSGISWSFASHKTILKWLIDTNSAGSGKTTLTTKVIDKIRAVKPTMNLVYFYCSFANTESLEGSAILGSLLIQLYQNPQLVITNLEPLYRTSKGQIRDSVQPKQLSNKDLLNLITDRISQLEEVYILIDGINESVDPESILESLRQIIHSCTGTAVHLFISSIDEKSIAPTLESFPDLRIEALRHDRLRSDIVLLVQESLNTNSRLRRYDSELKSQIQWSLTQGALGMFRWVQCQLDSLSRLRTPGAVKEALSRLPPTLDKTYESLLNRIDGEEDKILAREILEILAFVRRPLRLHQVSQMLQITPGMRNLNESKCLTDPKDILSICGSLLSYQQETGIVALAHPSVKTYLTSNLEGNARYFRLSSEEAHKALAIKCLTYLSFDAFSDGPRSSSNSFKERCVCFPLFNYAAEQWPIHVSRLGTLDESTWTLLKAFLFSGDKSRGNFFSWVQALTPDLSPAQILKTTPLYYAASYGLTFLVQFLLDAGADTEVHAGRGGATPINIASFRGHFDIVKLLLERGANPNAVDIYGSERSAIDWADYYGDREIFKLLTDSSLAHNRNALQTKSASSKDLKEPINTQHRDVVHVAPSSYWNATGSRKRLWWTLIALAEFQSHDPAATAISTFASNYLCLHGTPQTKGSAQYIEIVKGRGVSALVKPETADEQTTYRILIGSKILLDAQSNSMPLVSEALLTSNEDISNIPHFCWIHVGINDEYAGAIALTDAPIQETSSLQDNNAQEAPTVLDDYDKVMESQKAETKNAV